MQIKYHTKEGNALCSSSSEKNTFNKNKTIYLSYYDLSKHSENICETYSK